MATRKRGLGKGLGALLKVEEASVADKSSLDEIPLEWIRSGEHQPRKNFDDTALEELTQSIKAQGVMQPIVLRAIGKDQYEIIAGERRWRAAQQAGLEKIPAVVRAADNKSAIALSLIENVQREDLNPMEEAQALQRLVMEFNLTHQEIADALGKSRTAVTNSIRLNNLCREVTELLANGSIEMGHGRALLALTEQQQVVLAREIVSKQLSVRQTEEKVRKLGEAKSSASPKREVDADTRILQEKLSNKLGQPVRIQHTSRGKGKLIISYGSLDELDGILQQFSDFE